MNRHTVPTEYTKFVTTATLTVTSRHLLIISLSPPCHFPCHLPVTSPVISLSPPLSSPRHLPWHLLVNPYSLHTHHQFVPIHHWQCCVSLHIFLSPVAHSVAHSLTPLPPSIDMTVLSSHSPPQCTYTHLLRRLQRCVLEYAVLLYTSVYLLYTAEYILYTSVYLLYTAEYILYTSVYLLYTAEYILYTSVYLLYTAEYILYTSVYLLYTAEYILYTSVIFCIPLYSTQVQSKVEYYYQFCVDSFGLPVRDLGGEMAPLYTSPLYPWQLTTLYCYG